MELCRQVVHKTLLPTYDIFDEYRYFEQNTEFSLISYKGFNIAITICEDLWYKQPILTGFGKDRIYSVCPMDKIAALCPDLVINIAASPFSHMQGEIKVGDSYRQCIALQAAHLLCEPGWCSYRSDF